MRVHARMKKWFALKSCIKGNGTGFWILGFLIFGLMIPVVTSGCGTENRPLVQAQATNVSGFLATQPSHPATHQETGLTCKLFDKAGQPLRDAIVEVYFEMAEMDHGNNRVELHPTDTIGTYTGKIEFPMAGSWEAHVRATKQPFTQTLSFILHVQ